MPEGYIYRTFFRNIGKTLKSKWGKHNWLPPVAWFEGSSFPYGNSSKIMLYALFVWTHYQLKVFPFSLSFVLKIIIKSDICNKDTLWTSMNTTVQSLDCFDYDNRFGVLLNEEQKWIFGRTLFCSWEKSDLPRIQTTSYRRQWPAGVTTIHNVLCCFFICWNLWFQSKKWFQDL